MILVGANNTKFGELKTDLSNRYLLQDYQYLNNREGIFRLLNNWKVYKNKQPTTTNTTTVQYEVAFVQKDAFAEMTRTTRN